jgi:site-specific recombinase XerD
VAEGLHLSFQTSRYPFATRLLRKRERIEYVAKTMSHANIRETQFYTNIINTKVDKTMDLSFINATDVVGENFN